VSFTIDGRSGMLMVKDGRGSRDYFAPHHGRTPQVSISSCSVCRTVAASRTQELRDCVPRCTAEGRAQLARCQGLEEPGAAKICTQKFLLDSRTCFEACAGK
jgi:hypothetical protein